WTYSRPQLEEIFRQRRLVLDGVYQDGEETWLSARAAKKTYGIWPAGLGLWRTNPCPYLGGRLVRAKGMGRPAGREDHKSLWVYQEEDLKHIAAAQRTGVVSGTAQSPAGTPEQAAGYGSGPRAATSAASTTAAKEVPTGQAAERLPEHAWPVEPRN